MSNSENTVTVRLTKDLLDDGQEHHPPGVVARAGETGVVMRLYISGNVDVILSNPERFLRVHPGEFEVTELRAQTGEPPEAPVQEG